MNLNDATTALWVVKSHWSNFEVLDGNKLALQAGAWLDVLGDIDLADVRAALAQLDADGKEFPPTPGQIRETILAARGVCAPDWDQAHAAVIDSIRRHGVIGLPEWGEKPRPKLHPAIEDAVKAMGGWYEVGMAQATDAWRAQFRDVYRLAAARHDREAKAPPAARELTAACAQAAAALALPTGSLRNPQEETNQ